jgi:DNA-binding PadR family transcriptional regulator
MTQQTRAVLAEFNKKPDAELYGTVLKKRTKLHPGTLYPILNRLEEAGWLTSRREPRYGMPGYRQRSKGGPPRRYYRLTSEGWAVARQEAAPNRSRT